MIEGEPEDSSAVVNGDRQLSYLPSVSSVQSFWYKRRWVRVTRTVREGHYGRREETLEIWLVFHLLFHGCLHSHRNIQHPLIGPSYLERAFD